MEAFHYQALDANGHAVSGMVEAETARQARQQLRFRGLLPAQVRRIGARARPDNKLWTRGLPAAELSLLTRQLATLLGSGLTLEQSLTALIEEAESPLAREVLSGVKTEVTAGSSLALALGSYASSFPDFYRALVHGGAESGALATVLQHLADYLDAQQELKQKTTLALLYPTLVTLVALIIVTGLLVYVVPQVVDVFQQSRQALPLLTRALIALSDFLLLAWPWLLLLFVGLAAAVRLSLRNPQMQARCDAVLLGLPWLGALIRRLNTARFAGTLAILAGGGVPLLRALKTSASVMSNSVMAAAVARAGVRVQEGASLARALGETRVFPPLLVHMIASGESSGRLEQMLQRAATLETRALERQLAVFLTLLEPVMILVMGGVVLLIVLAILLPIIEINQLVL